MKDLTKVQDELAAEKAKNAALESALTELSAKVEALETTKVSKTSITATKARETTPEETFEVEKETYRFIVASFQHNGEKMTAADALKDKTLLLELVEGKFGIIEKTK